MLKKKKAAVEETKDGEPAKKKMTPAELRLSKDFAEIEFPPQCSHAFPEEGNMLKLEVVFDLTKEDCLWKGGKYKFHFVFPAEYPIQPPKATCITPIYHPNIDTQGNVCLNLLRADWKPVLNVYSVVVGCLCLFVEPNPNDPLNHEAAAVLRQNKTQFERNVKTSLQGGTVDGKSYPKFL